MQDVSHSQFLSLLRQRRIEVTARNGRLQVSAPPGAVDSECRAELARRKPELLRLLQSAEAATPGPLLPMTRTGRIPQTHAQQGLWLIDHFTPGNVAYNIPEAFIIEGSVEIEPLQKAVDDLLTRHEILRARFYEEEGELFQSISPEATAPLGFTDLSEIAESDRDQALHQKIREQARLPFDLRQAPLVRFHLFRLAEHRHVVLFNIHHIIADHRSLGILKEELILLYRAAVLNQTPELADLPIQYADYAIWSEKRLAEGAMAGQIEYWKAQLAGSPPYLELLSHRPYPEQRTAWGGNVLVTIPADVQRALQGIARQEDATIFMVLLASFAVLLYRRTGQQDFCVGSPFGHRNHIETESLIGLFVNMLVFRCRPTPELSFREFLGRVRTTALEAYEHSEVPFQELVRALKPDLRSRRSPLFQVMFVFDAEVRPGRAGLAQLDTDPGTAKFDLTLHLRQGPDGIAGWFEYCTDLFDAADVEQLSEQWLSLLVQIARDPDRPISSIEFLSTAQPELVTPAEKTPARPSFWSGRLKSLSQRVSHRLGTS